MSELNLNDLSGAELKEQADLLEIQYPHNISDEKLRDRIRSTLNGDPDLGSEEGDPEHAGITDAEDSQPAGKRRKYKIKIHKDGKDKQPVPLACNGKVIRVMRGHEVTISEGHFNSLRNAVKLVYHQDEDGKMEAEEVHSYPFELLETIEV